MEASIVLPIIVLAVVTVVLIVVYFYEQIDDQCRMHMYLRSSAGAITEQTICVNPVKWDGTTETKRQLFGGYVYGKRYLIMRNRGIIGGNTAVTHEATCHIVDGPKYVRYCTMIKGTLLNEEQ